MFDLPDTTVPYRILLFILRNPHTPLADKAWLVLARLAYHALYPNVDHDLKQWIEGVFGLAWIDLDYPDYPPPDSPLWQRLHERLQAAMVVVSPVEELLRLEQAALNALPLATKTEMKAKMQAAIATAKE